MDQASPAGRTEQWQSLHEVLGQLQEVFVVCDANDVIVFANERFRFMHPEVEPWTRPGNTYEDFLRACVAHRLLPIALGREDEYLRQAIARRREGGPWPVEFQFASGLWLMINYSKLSNGNSVTCGVDISARKRTESALAQQTERLLIGQRTAGMIVMDWDIRADVLSWSDDPAWLRGPLPPSGKYPLYKDQVHPEDRERFLAVRNQGIDNLERHDQEYRLVRTDGSMLWLRSERVVLAGPDGRATRMLVALHDISRRKEVELALQQANEKLEARVTERTAALAAANRDLESFSYSVSHDLRAPLRHIAGFVNLLREQDGQTLSTEGRRHLAVIEDNALRMGALIDALLALAHASRTAMVNEVVDMQALAHAACTECASGYPGVQVEIGPLPAAQGDATLLRQVFVNLLDNALKYSANVETPQVTIGAEALATGTVYFVRDNGVGFDMAHAGKLFEPFHRLHADARYSGDGIGLAVASQIVQRHQGRLWAQSAQGQGATFRFTLGGTER